jgi:hypothetical protein
MRGRDTRKLQIDGVVKIYVFSAPSQDRCISVQERLKQAAKPLKTGRKTWSLDITNEKFDASEPGINDMRAKKAPLLGQ